MPAISFVGSCGGTLTVAASIACACLIAATGIELIGAAGRCGGGGGAPAAAGFGGAAGLAAAGFGAAAAENKIQIFQA